MWRQLLSPLAGGQDPEGGSGACDQPYCPKRTRGHEHDPCGPGPSQEASADDQAAVDSPVGGVSSPVDDVNKGAVGSPVDDVNKGAVETPVDDVNRGAVGIPVDDGSNAGVGSPVDDVNKGAVVTPVDDVNKGAVGSPVDDGSKAAVDSPVGGVSSPVDDVNKDAVGSPVDDVNKGAVETPVDDVNRGAVGSPVDDGSNAGVGSPVDDVNKGAVVTPVDDVNKGAVGSPVDDGSKAAVDSPVGGVSSPVDDVNKDAVGSPVDDVNKGAVETPVDDVNRGAVGSPVDDGSNAGVGSPVDDVNKGAVVTPVDDVNKGAVGIPVDDGSNAGVGSPVDDVNKGAVETPVDDVNKGAVGSPVDDGSNAGVGSPVDDVNKGAVETPVDDVNKGAVGSPVDDESKAAADSPVGGVSSPVDDVNKGAVETPVDDVNKGPSGGVTIAANVAFGSPVDDVNKGAVETPVDDVNKGAVETPVDDVNKGAVGSPVDDGSKAAADSPVGGVSSPVDDVNKGAVETPVDDVNKGPSGGVTIAANVAFGSPVDDGSEARVATPDSGVGNPVDDVKKDADGRPVVEVAIAANIAVGSPVNDAAKPQPPEPAKQPTPPGDTEERDKYVSKNGERNEGLPPEITDEFCLDDHPIEVQFEDVTKAAYFIKSGVVFTPCVPSHLPDLTGMSIFLKKDFMQYTGSFKERGARYTLLMLSPEQRQRGVVSASAGNHAQALCYHGGLLGVPVTVVMPLIAPIMKVHNCRRLRANVVVKGKDMTEAKRWAMHIAQQRGLLYINGYDHPHVLAGQGTCGLEIVEQVPDVDAVLVPVGGGGLLAGVAVAVKSLKPAVQVIAVESEACAGWSAAMREGRPVASVCGPSLADGLAVSKVGVNAFATARPLVDKVVTVPEEFIAVAILRLAELEKCVVEGAGAAGLAAILSGRLDELKGKTVVAILSGGNIDTTVLGRVLDRGLAADGRLVKFCVPLLDRPGGLDELTCLLAALGVSVKELAFERAWMKDDVFKLKAQVVCESRDARHAEQLRVALLEQFAGQVLFGDVPLPAHK